MNVFIFPCKTTGCEAWLEMPEDKPRDENIRLKCPVCQKEHRYKFSEKQISAVILCKRDGCKHPLSVHNTSPVESCSARGCECLAYLSPHA